MIEAVATSHIVGMPLSKSMQGGTIGVAKADAASRNQKRHEPSYESPQHHRTQAQLTGA